MQAENAGEVLQMERNLGDIISPRNPDSDKWTIETLPFFSPKVKKKMNMAGIK